MTRIKFAVALLAVTALAGCVVDGPAPRTDNRVASQTGFEGSWGDTGGVATATLRSGTFISVANDTGNKVAEGSYQQVDSRMIELNYTSLLRNTQVRANCILATQNQLNCTNDAGQQFSLLRRPSVG